VALAFWIVAIPPLWLPLVVHGAPSASWWHRFKSTLACTDFTADLTMWFRQFGHFWKREFSTNI